MNLLEGTIKLPFRWLEDELEYFNTDDGKATLGIPGGLLALRYVYKDIKYFSDFRIRKKDTMEHTGAILRHAYMLPLPYLYIQGQLVLIFLFLPPVVSLVLLVHVWKKVPKIIV